jgi:uncharacterized protein YbjT (DUF2867 family)
MIIAITGATGFTGAFVVRDLAARYPAAQLRCLVRPTSNRGVLASHGVEFVEGDLRDGPSLDRLFAGADALVNVSSLGGEWVDPLFDAVARSTTLRRGVFVSTTAILTKLPVRSRPLREHGEARVRQSGLQWTILRPTMIYGTPGDRNIARLIRFVGWCPVVPMVAGEALQQPVHVEDVATAIVACLATPATIGRTYEISGRDPLTFEQLVRQTIAATGRRGLLVPVPFGPMLAALKVYAACVATPRIRVEQLLRLREDKAFDHSAASREFGFAPRSFAEGVRAEVGLLRKKAGTQ